MEARDLADHNVSSYSMDVSDWSSSSTRKSAMANFAKHSIYKLMDE